MAKAKNILKSICGNLNNEKIMYLEISVRFIIVKLLTKILSIHLDSSWVSWLLSKFSD